MSDDANSQLLDLLKQLSAKSKNNVTVDPPRIIQGTSVNSKINSGQRVKWDREHREEEETDPSTITTYKEALRHFVFFTSRKNTSVEGIKQIVAKQKELEERWFQERKDLTAKLNDRDKDQRELNNVYKLVGAASSSSNRSEERAKELRNFDMKIYKHMVELAEKQKQELRALDIPLFCVRDNLKDDKWDGEVKQMLKFLNDLFG